MSRNRTWLAISLGCAGAAFLLTLLPGLFGPYGAFIDELYYVSCAKRLAWGYVDHPPLAPFVLWLSRGLFGDGLFAVRLPGALGAAGLVLLGGCLARRLGAGLVGVSLACASLLATPALWLMFSFYSVNFFEILLWTLLLWILCEIELRQAPRLWLLFGGVAGLALLDKHTVVLLVAALGVGFLATQARRHLASPWLWLGAAVAGLIALPNLLWQMAHDWPSLEFYRNASLFKQTKIPPYEVVLQQLLFLNPGIAPLWVSGLVSLWRRRDPPMRHITLGYLSLLGLFVVSGESRPDRLFGFYPCLLAAGAVAVERWAKAPAAEGGQGTRVRPLRLAAVALGMLLGALPLAPIGVPILPPEKTASWAGRLGIQPQMEQGEGKRTPLPQWFADRVGWQELLDDVASVRDRLTPQERESVIYFAPSYGQAGALDWLGEDLGLTPVYAAHNTWYLWGPPVEPIEVAIVLGYERDVLEEFFADVELAKEHECGLCMPWRNHMPIWIVRQQKASIADRWPAFKNYQ